MKLNQEQDLFQQFNHLQCENNNLFLSNFREQFFQKMDKNTLNKTEVSELLESGQWRSNVFITDTPMHVLQGSLKLKHATSFQLKSMEDHGRRLKITLEDYARAIKRYRCPQEEVEEPIKFETETCEQLQQALALIPHLDLQKKNLLIDFSSKNTEAQIILRQMLLEFPSNYLSQALLFLSKLFEHYQLESVSKMDEDQIQTFVNLSYDRISDSIKDQIEKKQLLPLNLQEEFQFSNMIAIWMETVFLALNGVFQNPCQRKSPLAQIEGYETFCTVRKLVKLD